MVRIRDPSRIDTIEIRKALLSPDRKRGEILESFTRTPRPTLSAITREDLEDDSALAELYRQAVRRGFVGAGSHQVYEFFALAERALERDNRETPGALFFHMLQNKLFKYITNSCDDRSRSRLAVGIDDAGCIAWSARHCAPGRAANVSAKERNEEYQGHGYLHSLLVQNPLPQKNYPGKIYRCRNGKAGLVVRAGVIGDPSMPGQIMQCEVPWGSRARLLLAYINGFAKRYGTLVIPLGRNLRDLAALLGIVWGGNIGSQLQRQIRNIAAAEFLLTDWTKHSHKTRYTRVSEEYLAWLSTDGTREDWLSKLKLSQRCFDELRKRPVPIDLNALVRLRKSPRRMDICNYVKYRVHLQKGEEPARLPLSKMRRLFYKDLAPNNHRGFRHKLTRDLSVVKDKSSFKWTYAIGAKFLTLHSSP